MAGPFFLNKFFWGCPRRRLPIVGGGAVGRPAHPLAVHSTRQPLAAVSYGVRCVHAIMGCPCPIGWPAAHTAPTPHAAPQRLWAFVFATPCPAEQVYYKS